MRQQLFLLIPLPAQTAAPLSEPARDFRLGRAQRGALQLIGECHQRLALAYLRALLDMQSGHDAGPRREHAHQPLLRHQPTADPGFPREVRVEQQPYDRRRTKHAEHGEKGVRQPRCKQHRAEPLCLALCKHFGPEQGGPRAGSARRSALRVVGPCRTSPAALSGKADYVVSVWQLQPKPSTSPKMPATAPELSSACSGRSNAGS